MNYKAQYSPTEILCPVTFTWVPIEPVKNELLQKHKFCRFAAPNAKSNNNSGAANNGDSVTIVVKNTKLPYSLLKQKNVLSPAIVTIAQLFEKSVGKENASQMLLEL